MHERWHRVEKIVDRSIPALLVLLLIVIVLELFFDELVHDYLLLLDGIDTFIILVFAVDLVFKYQRVQKVQPFLRKYWLEIIAVVPFFLVFRLLEVLRFTELFEQGQQILHGGVEVEKEAVAIRNAAKGGQVSRAQKFARFFRIGARSPRFLKVLPFFEEPTGKHHR